MYAIKSPQKYNNEIPLQGPTIETSPQEALQSSFHLRLLLHNTSQLLLPWHQRGIHHDEDSPSAHLWLAGGEQAGEEPVVDDVHGKPTGHIQV